MKSYLAMRDLKMKLLTLTKVLPALAAVLLALAIATIRPLQVRAAGDSYQSVANWAQLPAGVTWGGMVGVAIDAKGNIYAFQRQDPMTKAPSRIMVFDAQGRYLKDFTDFNFPGGHSLRIYDGAVWVADRQLQQVLKFDMNGKLLLSLGQAGVTGDNSSETAFNGTSDVAVAKNGDVFVSDGEGANTRVVKFSKDGKFIRYWGTKGSGPGQFVTPHSIAIDSKGRVCVVDEGNKRIQIFDQDGNFLEQMTQFGAPHVLFITKDDMVYIASTMAENRIMIATAQGKILDTFDAPSPGGITVAADGAIYMSEVGGKAILKYVKK